MSDIKCGSLILDAIDQLRKRKARPDLDRICHMLERRHGLKGSEVNEELSKLVREGAVIKVDYKGNTSYRNAAKWVRTKTQFFGSYYNSSDISTVVLEAVLALTLPSNDQVQLKSASIHDIEQYLLKRDAQSNLNLATLKAVLEKEVAKKSIHQLPSGEFAALTQSASEVITIEKTSQECLKKSSPPLTPISLKADPDEVEAGFKWTDYRCDYCLLTSYANRKDEPEPLLRCRECNAKAHPSCTEYIIPKEKSANDIHWKCPDCKTCAKCNGTYPGHFDELLTCDICHTDYHMACHEPPILSKPTESWFCNRCDTRNRSLRCLKNNSEFSTNSLKEEIFDGALRETFLKSIEQYPLSIPYASNWTIDNVEAFFKFIGFEEEAQAFRDEEIDGLSLLLMKRDDVLTGLGIKLGPALKIYSHILKLQSIVGE